MSSVNGVGSSGNAWAAASAQKSQMQARMFAKVDSDSSGSVDTTELKAMLADVDQKLGTSHSISADALMANFDSDADGSLSSEELAKGMKDVLPPPSTLQFAQSRTEVQGGSDAAAELFASLDSNGDGSLDADELQVQNDRVRAETGRDTSDAFARMDSDGDGKLSATEFAAGGPPPAQGGQAAGQAQGAGGPQGPGGPRGAGGARAADSSSTTYDALDTNKDGVVSELERLAGELAEIVASEETTNSSSSELARFAEQLYAQIAGNGSSQAAGNAIDALA